MTTILLNSTGTNIVDSVINCFNMFPTFNTTNTNSLSLTTDHSGNYVATGTVISTDNTTGKKTTYTKTQEIDYTANLITDATIISNYNYIITNDTKSIATITVYYNDVTYTTNKYFSINGNNYYVLIA